MKWQQIHVHAGVRFSNGSFKGLLVLLTRSIAHIKSNMIINVDWNYLVLPLTCTPIVLGTMGWPNYFWMSNDVALSPSIKCAGIWLSMEGFKQKCKCDRAFDSTDNGVEELGSYYVNCSGMTSCIPWCNHKYDADGYALQGKHIWEDTIYN